MKPRLFLIDSFALAYRSHYAFIKNPLLTSTGLHTSVLFGYLSQIFRILEEEKPSHLAIVKDLSGPTFRHQFYSSYKAQRKPMPEELREQLPALDRFFHLAQIPVLSQEGFEADDIMASLALHAKDNGFEVFILTKDKDLMQIVDDQIKLYESGSRRDPPLIRGPKEVEEKFGVPPAQMGDLLALMGDSADNIPGVPQVGPKTALGLIKTFGNITNLYKNIHKVDKASLREKLHTYREQLQLSQKLVQLATQVPIPVPLEALQVHPPVLSEISEYLKEWELHSLQTALSKAYPQGPSPLPSNYQAARGHYELLKPSDATSFIEQAFNAKTVALDTETTGLNVYTDQLVGLCISIEAQKGYYLPCGHSTDNLWTQEQLLQLILRPLFENPALDLIFHNAKFDLHILKNLGLSYPKGRVADTLIMAHLLDPGKRGLSLDELIHKNFGYAMIPIEQLIGPKGKDQKNFKDVPVAQAVSYGAEDADFTLRLYWSLLPKLEKNSLNIPLWEVEMPLLPVLLAMEEKGICIDQTVLNALETEQKEELAQLEAQVWSLAGHQFNLSSTQQTAEVLFEKLGLEGGKKNKTGLSTDQATLYKLKGSHPCIDPLLEYRELHKLLSTYTSTLPQMVHPHSGRIHTSFSQTIAATGRLSSINPNLQNIPIRTLAGKKIRAAFISAPGKILLSADYSQIELRILAHLSKDPALIEAYQNNQDIHTLTAAALYQVAQDKVDANMRRSAKVVNFGILYGMGSYRLASELGIPREQAKNFITSYFNRFPCIEPFFQNTLDKARRLGYVETLSGRRRYLPELLSDNRLIREGAERMAANTPIQGSAADLIKHAMVRIHKALQHQPLPCQLLLQVHDELVFECDPDSLPQISLLIKESMENALRLSVPLKVELGQSPTWLGAHG